MKICILGKIPPVQGGTPRETFYTAYYLAKAGHEVHIITNSLEVEAQYRIFSINYFDKIDTRFSDEIKKLPLYIHATYPDNRQIYIPQGNPVVTKLTSLTMSLIQDKGIKFDLIYAIYFEPYAVAAALISSMSDIPYVIRHAGSDISRLFSFDTLTHCYKHILSNASGIITNRTHLATYHENNIGIEKLMYDIDACVFPEQFKSDEVLDVNGYLEFVRRIEHPYIRKYFSSFYDHHFDESLPTIGVYGKTSVYKGHFDLVKSLGYLKQKGLKFNLLGLIQGPAHNLEQLIIALHDSNIFEESLLLPYIPHWHMPRFFNKVDVVCYLERDFPIECHMPSIPREVLNSGRCLITSTEIFNKARLLMPTLKALENVLVAEPTDFKMLASTIEFAMTNKERANEIGRKGKEVVNVQDVLSEDYVTNISKQFISVTGSAQSNNQFQKMMRCPFDEKDPDNKMIYCSGFDKRLRIIFRRSFFVKDIEKTLSSLNVGFLNKIYPQKLTNKQLVDAYLKFVEDFLENDTNAMMKNFIVESLQFDAVYFNKVLIKLPNKKTDLLDISTFKKAIPVIHQEGAFNTFMIRPDRSRLPDLEYQRLSKEIYFLRPRYFHHDIGIYKISYDLYQYLLRLDGLKSIEEIVEKDEEMMQILYKLYENRIIECM